MKIDNSMTAYILLQNKVSGTYAFTMQHKDFKIESCIFTFISPLQTGATPLYIASQSGHINIVNILLNNGADTTLAKSVSLEFHMDNSPITWVYTIKTKECTSICSGGRVQLTICLCVCNFPYRVGQLVCILPVKRDTGV